VRATEGEGLELARWAANQIRLGIDMNEPDVAGRRVSSCFGRRYRLGFCRRRPDAAEPVDEAGKAISGVDAEFTADGPQTRG
jgi:hypothetical protein